MDKTLSLVNLQKSWLALRWLYTEPVAAKVISFSEARLRRCVRADKTLPASPLDSAFSVLDAARGASFEHKAQLFTETFRAAMRVQKRSDKQR